MDSNILNSSRKPRGKKEYFFDEQTGEEQDLHKTISATLTTDESPKTQHEKTQTAEQPTIAITSVRVKQKQHVDGQGVGERKTAS